MQVFFVFENFEVYVRKRRQRDDAKSEDVNKSITFLYVLPGRGPICQFTSTKPAQNASTDEDWI